MDGRSNFSLSADAMLDALLSGDWEMETIVPPAATRAASAANEPPPTPEPDPEVPVASVLSGVEGILQKKVAEGRLTMEEKADIERRHLLFQMLSEGTITDEEYAQAAAANSFRFDAASASSPASLVSAAKKKAMDKEARRLEKEEELLEKKKAKEAEILAEKQAKENELAAKKKAKEEATAAKIQKKVDELAAKKKAVDDVERSRELFEVQLREGTAGASSPRGAELPPTVQTTPPPQAPRLLDAEVDKMKQDFIAMKQKEVADAAGGARRAKNEKAAALTEKKKAKEAELAARKKEKEDAALAKKQAEALQVAPKDQASNMSKYQRSPMTARVPDIPAESDVQVPAAGQPRAARRLSLTVKSLFQMRKKRDQEASATPEHELTSLSPQTLEPKDLPKGDALAVAAAHSGHRHHDDDGNGGSDDDDDDSEDSDADDGDDDCDAKDASKSGLRDSVSRESVSDFRGSLISPDLFNGASSGLFEDGDDAPQASSDAATAKVSGRLMRALWEKEAIESLFGSSDGDASAPETPSLVPTGLFDAAPVAKKPAEAPVKLAPSAPPSAPAASSSVPRCLARATLDWSCAVCCAANPISSYGCKMCQVPKEFDFEDAWLAGRPRPAKEQVKALYATLVSMGFPHLVLPMLKFGVESESDLQDLNVILCRCFPLQLLVMVNMRVRPTELDGLFLCVSRVCVCAVRQDWMREPDEAIEMAQEFSLPAADIDRFKEALKNYLKYGLKPRKAAAGATALAVTKNLFGDDSGLHSDDGAWMSSDSKKAGANCKLTAMEQRKRDLFEEGWEDEDASSDEKGLSVDIFEAAAASSRSPAAAGLKIFDDEEEAWASRAVPAAKKGIDEITQMLDAVGGPGTGGFVDETFGGSGGFDSLLGSFDGQADGQASGSFGCGDDAAPLRTSLFTASLAASSADDAARVAERRVLEQRREAYEASVVGELDQAEANPFLRAGKGAAVEPVPGDGNCVPRAFLVAVGRAYDDQAVAALRSSVLGVIAGDRARYMPLVMQGPNEGGGNAADMFDNHLRRMRGSGIFFEEPELQALADLFERYIVVDAVVVATGWASRKAFAPKKAGVGHGVAHLVLWVCAVNASHCDPVIKRSRAMAL